nr:recombinase family protein [Croceicoccus hydrothermalis]
MVVWKLDCLGRSMSHLIKKVGDLERSSIEFYSISETIGTISSARMTVFNIFGSLAQLKHNLIRERTHAGLKTARERGNTSGNLPAITQKSYEKQARYRSGRHCS